MFSKNSCQALHPCDHEEADTRIVLHLFDAVSKGARDILVRTVDSDTIAILIGAFSKFHPGTNIWIAFGAGKKFRYYSINSIYQSLGPEKSKALPYYHAFSGCDTTSQFHGKGKKSVWDAWEVYEDVTTAFNHISDNPFQPLSLQSPIFSTLERFACILYDKSTTLSSVNELRQELFSKKSVMMENIPPTQVI